MMARQNRDLSDMDSRKFLEALLSLVHQHAGQPVALVEQEGCPMIGVMNIVVDNDDWMLEPIALPEFVILTTEE